MRFLSVAERELRAAARRSRTFFVRWITALAFFALLLWLFWAFDVFRNRRAVPEVFTVFSGFVFFYCLLIGTAQTADCLSSEKREGTLGLLFLTNLNSADIIAGKLCSSALVTVYGLFAIFPMMALPLLLGGITFAHFWQTVLALVNVILFSIAAGFVASVLCVRQFTAIAVATGLALSVGVGLLGAAALVDAARGPKLWVEGLASFCPFYTLLAADGSRMFGANQYWLSLALVACLSLGWLVLVTLRLGRTWRDQPKSARWPLRLPRLQRWRTRDSAGRRQFRKRLLDRNPFLWLAGRSRVSAPVFMVLIVILIAIASFAVTPYFTRVMRVGGGIGPLVGCFFTWLWTGLAIHALVLYYAAMIASQRLAEDKQTGALELILCTPTTERQISRGLWLAFVRRMLFPVLVAVLVHFFVAWQAATLFIMDGPARLPATMTPGRLLWLVLVNQPAWLERSGWEIFFIFRIILFFLLMAVICWFTLGWVGRWLGLKMKHPGFAPMTALALLFIPPILTFSLACYLADRFHLDRMPEREFLPLMLWAAFGIGVGHCVVLCVWAAHRLRTEFRTTVTGRFQPPSARRWWRISWRLVGRLALTMGALIALVAFSVPALYGFQNWKSHRHWTAFQKQLAQRGESLDVRPLLPAPVPDAENFARTPAFQRLLARMKAKPQQFLGKLRRLETASFAYQNNAQTLNWPGQTLAALSDAPDWMNPPVKVSDRAKWAPAVVQSLAVEATELRQLAEAARRPYCQYTTERSTMAVVQPPREAITALEQLHFLFRLRALAHLECHQAAEAAEDLLTSLRFARFAGQSPDVLASAREQVLATRSLQPLWEGVVRHQWTEPQLAAIQTELAGLNLLADHTNTVRRIVCAYIESWLVLRKDAVRSSVPSSTGGYFRQSGWEFQPSGWWYDRCIQLHEAGLRAIERVDVAAGRVRLEVNWDDLRGLPLDNETQQLLQQYAWNGAHPGLVSFAQTAVNQGILACALERWWLAQGKYPETLEQLAPAYLDRLPHDLVRGRPLIYQRLDDTHFILRGVGPNEVDDRKLKTSDDWLWAFPTNAPPKTAASPK
jgi:ABC-type transport system involved in multi-copper enzyme maturation permease subunit